MSTTTAWLLAATLLTAPNASARNAKDASGLDAPRTRRYAIIIGVNRADGLREQTLQYADDDAVRFYQLFRWLPGDAALFTLPDADTQRNYPDVVASAELPEKARIFQRIDAMFRRMSEGHARGETSEFYLIYSGHGRVDDHGQGVVRLQDADFSRGELYQHVLARSPADLNHLVIDACDAFHFVQSRGPSDVDARLDAAAREFLDRQTLARYPATGAILSTAAAAESHEWSEIRAGVFSHEVRSGLLGAADADQNGAVSYEELEAFVLAANHGVALGGDERAVFVRPPDRLRAHPVLDLDALPATAHRLELGPEQAGRIALSDVRGRRYLDVNKAPGFRISLRLLPDTRYFLRIEGRDYAIPSDVSVIADDALAALPATTTARGATADAFARGLFTVPFGPTLVDGFRLGQASRITAFEATRDRARPVRTAAFITAGAALVGGALAGGSYGFGQSAYRDYQRFEGDDLSKLAELNGRVQTWDTRTHLALGAAVALGVSAGVLFLLDSLAGDR